MHDLLSQIANALSTGPDRQAGFDKALHLLLAHFQSETGTIHTLNSEQQLLHLAAQSGLPPAMLDIIKTIPVGKGIAGETAARGAPVTLCNLQSDTSGVARPGARQTGVGGALCVPIRKNESVAGTLGIGTIRPYQYTAEETSLLEEAGSLLAEYL
jgi:GAF domain-containing protein